ncbi:MAG: ASCH domain-containing protein [Granulosicoccus sp.]
MSMDINDVLNKYPGATTFKFGDSKSLSDLLLSLVRQGKKTATCAALYDFTEGDEVMPVVGRQDIACEWDDTPALVIQTIAVEHKRFCDVDEEFALLEGENDDLQGWRIDHQEYFERNGKFDENMMLVCERFELIEDLKMINDATEGN